MATKKTTEKQLTVLDGANFTLAQFEAQQALQTREVPEKMISERPGRGKKTFKYIKHPHGTQLLLDTQGPWFSHDVTWASILDDGSAVAFVCLKIHTPIFNENGELNQIFTNSITEVGSFVGSDGMEHAYKMGSAASRGLMKCVMRRFGVGLEFYIDDDEPTAQDAWEMIWKYARRQTGIKQEDLLPALAELFRNAGIAKEDLADRFSEAWKLIQDFVDKAKGKQDTPDFPVGDDSASPAPEQEPKKKEPEVDIDDWGEFYTKAMADFNMSREDVYALLCEAAGGKEKVKSKTPTHWYQLIAKGLSTRTEKAKAGPDTGGNGKDEIVMDLEIALATKCQADAAQLGLKSGFTLGDALRLDDTAKVKQMITYLATEPIPDPVLQAAAKYILDNWNKAVGIADAQMMDELPF